MNIKPRFSLGIFLELHIQHKLMAQNIRMFSLCHKISPVIETFTAFLKLMTHSCKQNPGNLKELTFSVISKCVICYYQRCVTSGNY